MGSVFCGGGVCVFLGLDLEAGGGDRLEGSDVMERKSYVELCDGEREEGVIADLHLLEVVKVVDFGEVADLHSIRLYEGAVFGLAGEVPRILHGSVILPCYISSAIFSGE